MALLVTILLMMINFATEISNESPVTDAFSALDLWMLSKNISAYNSEIT